MRIFIEADSIATDRISGIGHATLEIIRAISKLIDGSEHSLTIIVPYGKRLKVKSYAFKNVLVKTLPPAYRYVNYLFVRTSIPFPVDALFGKGVYIFPNYKTWFLSRSRSLTFVHDVAYKILPETTNPANLRYLRKNMKTWLSRADKVLTISESSKKDILNFFPEVKSKLEVVYLGVNKKDYKPRSPNEVRSILKKYGLDDDYFLYLGNIEPRKNIENLLIAYKEYADSVQKPLQMVLVGGGGWNDDSIKNRMKLLTREGYNIFKPKDYVVDTDLPALYTGARALVHVSLHEGFGLSLLQAQACGTTIIASNLEVFKETLDNKNVIYVDGKNVQTISRAMVTVSKETKDKNIPSVPKHTWEQTAKELLSLAGIMVNSK